jgi:hypothetical protein
MKRPFSINLGLMNIEIDVLVCVSLSIHDYTDPFIYAQKKMKSIRICRMIKKK